MKEDGEVLDAKLKVRLSEIIQEEIAEVLAKEREDIIRRSHKRLRREFSPEEKAAE